MIFNQKQKGKSSHCAIPHRPAALAPGTRGGGRGLPVPWTRHAMRQLGYLLETGQQQGENTG